MLTLNIGSPGNGKTLLFLGAHPDDIEIGCGGTVIRLLKEWHISNVVWMVFSGNAARRREARASASDFLKDVKNKTIVVKNFRDGYFPYEGGRIKDAFEALKRIVVPDVIFTHYRDDRHQDHRVISDLTWNTFRAHLILEYEIPKYDGDLGAPNFFVPLKETIYREKAKLILKHFATQNSKHWFSTDAFLALGRIRGVESGTSDHYAEAYYSRKLTI